MYRLDNLIEQWATEFKLVSHNPEGGADGKRFFRIDSISDLKPVILSLTKIKTPVVAYSTQIEGSSNEGGNGTYYLANIFILVSQEKTTAPYREDLNAANAKYLAVEIAEKLKAWLMEKKKNEKQYPELRGLNLKSVATASFPVKLGNWWPLHIQMDYLNTDYVCVNPEDYHQNEAGEGEQP